MVARSSYCPSFLWSLASLALTVLITFCFFKTPSLTATAVVGCALAFIVWTYPVSAIAIVFGVDGLLLVYQIAGINVSQLWYGSFVLLLIAFVSSFRFLPPYMRHKIVVVTVALVFVLMYGALVSGGALPSAQVLEGIRYVSTPVLCGLIAVISSRKAATVLLRLATVVVVMSAIAGALQRAAGVDSLIAIGLQLGTGVRTFDGVIRASGLFATNYSMGAFAGVVGALALLWWPSLESGRRASFWRAGAVIASIACLFFSIYRTGMLLLGVAVVLWVVFAKGRGSVVRKIALSVAAVVGVSLVFRSGFGSNSSYLERMHVWGDVLSTSPPKLFGYGIGYSGAASGSRFAETRVTVDNYFLSLLLQFGAISLFIVVALAILAAWMTVRARSTPVLRSGMVLAGCLVAFFFVEYWEYTGAMCALMFSVGFGLRSHADSNYGVFQRPVVPIS